ncbi:MAG: YraN family protein [Bacteroidetes bacterium]|nr:YraN family protein [Bacteroidota bacterium]
MSKKTGDKGEQIAANHLRKRGYTILEVNWRHQHLELDIIAQKDNFLVIVEVKTGNSITFGEPHEWVTRKKQLRIIKAADAYVMEHNIQTETRFDIVGILLTAQDPQVNHIEDAFSTAG